MEENLVALRREVDSLKLELERERLARTTTRNTFLAVSAALLGLLGYTAFIEIPRVAHAVLMDSAAGTMLKQLEHNQARVESEILPAREDALSRALDAAEATAHSELAATEAMRRIETTSSSKLADLKARLVPLEACEERFSQSVLWGVNASGQIFRSTNKGESWTRAGSGILKQIAVSDGVLWGVNNDDSIFRSTDEGITWKSVNGRLNYIAAWP